MSPAPLLTVTGLRTVFPLGDGCEAAAVDGVSFTIDRGETLGLVGESGSGKSVTALSIVRLVLPPGRIAAGRVLLDGTDLLTLDEASMRRIRGRRIGFIFQEPSAALNPVYTIGSQIREVLTIHGLARGNGAHRRAIELLDAVRISDAARRAGDYPHQLSGGLRQRAMIALALAAEPSLVIADEPTTALDVTVQAEILDLLRDLRRQFQLSLLLITHDFGVVAELADRVAVMYAGRIVETAPAASLFSDPRHPYTRGLLESIPSGIPGTPLRAIPGVVPLLGQSSPGCPFSPRCPERISRCDEEMPPVTAIPGAGMREVRCHLHAPTPDFIGNPR